MAITTRTSTVTSGNRTTGFTLAIGADVATGDILVLAITNRDATTDPTVSDNDTGGNAWAKLAGQVANTNGAVTVWWKRATAGTAAKTITVADCTGSCSGVVTPFVGGSTSATPFAGTTIVSAACASGTETQGGITTQANGSAVILVVGCTSDDAVNVTTQAGTDPSSLTEQGAVTTLRALEYGAVDIITKPRLGARQFLEENRIRLLFILNGIFGVFTLAGALLDSPQIYLIGSLVFWFPVFTAATASTAWLFNRSVKDERTTQGPMR